MSTLQTCLKAKLNNTSTIEKETLFTIEFDKQVTAFEMWFTKFNDKIFLD